MFKLCISNHIYHTKRLPYLNQTSGNLAWKQAYSLGAWLPVENVVKLLINDFIN